MYAAQRMGVDPAACAVIEDSRPGVKAARAAHPGQRAMTFRQPSIVTVEAGAGRAP
ncbi:hypothetical protein [Streptomyces sp. NBC_00659]|uniref:hypothetical protein n=1 Tax=Streptomyces sp. NBC_00659 TaxID=2903669 RepID=UPI003FCE5B2A